MSFVSNVTFKAGPEDDGRYSTVERLDAVYYYNRDGLVLIRFEGNLHQHLTVLNHDNTLHTLLGEEVLVVWRDTFTVELLCSIRFEGQQLVTRPRV